MPLKASGCTGLCTESSPLDPSGEVITATRDLRAMADAGLLVPAARNAGGIIGVQTNCGRHGT
jgi:hypothetical protein